MINYITNVYNIIRTDIENDNNDTTLYYDIHNSEENGYVILDIYTIRRQSSMESPNHVRDINPEN